MVDVVNNIRINFCYSFYSFYKNIFLTFNCQFLMKFLKNISFFFFIVNFIVTDKKYIFSRCLMVSFLEIQESISYKVLITIFVQVLSNVFEYKRLILDYLYHFLLKSSLKCDNLLIRNDTFNSSIHKFLKNTNSIRKIFIIHKIFNITQLLMIFQ